MPALIVGLVVALGLAALVVYLSFRSTKRKHIAALKSAASKQVSETAYLVKVERLKALLPQALAGDWEVIEALGGYYGGEQWSTFIGGLTDATFKSEVLAAIKEGRIVNCTRRVQNAYDELLVAKDGATAKQLELAAKLVQIYNPFYQFEQEVSTRTGLAREQALDMLNELLVRHFDELVAAAIAGDTEAYDIAYALRVSGSYTKLGATSLAWPDGWNDIVHLHERCPVRAKFDLPPLSANDVALIAADADRDGNVTQAKIVIACGADPNIRDQVGLTLWTAMLRMVAQHEHDKANGAATQVTA